MSRESDLHSDLDKKEYPALAELDILIFINGTAWMDRTQLRQEIQRFTSK